MRAYDPDLRPQFTQQWNTFVEYQLTSTMSAQVGYVGHHATHLVTPVEGNQALPGVGDPSTWAPKNTRRPSVRRAAAHHDHCDDARLGGGSKYNSMQASVRQRLSGGAEFLASYTLAKGHDQQPRLLRHLRWNGVARRHQRNRRRVLAEHLQPRRGVGAGVP